jgi:4-diphosphocytidyl-2-C-methyl-D-erythritol kinase
VPIRVRACAKVNLFLRVLGARSDGYHDIETIFHGVSLCDELAFAPRPTGVEIRTAPGARGVLPPVRDNLIARAAQLFADQAARRGVSVRVVKRIPVGGGLGGGSVDAAATLVALNELWDLGLDAAGLSRAATALGSDVAYFLAGGTVLATGRGEKLVPIASPAALWLVLGISDVPLLTRDVYARWDKHRTRGPTSSALVDALGRGDVSAVGARLHNDLEPAAISLRPELAAARDVLLDAGALGAAVSGSGPTVFGLAGSEDHARSLAAAVSARFDAVEVVRGATTSVEVLGGG